MTTIVNITLENEMDLVLAHRRSLKLAERIGLTVATQTTFATAVSEIARAVIEHTDNGHLEIGLEQNDQRYSLKAQVTLGSDIHFTNADEGFYYAQKLVPEFTVIATDGKTVIAMKIGLPRSLKLDPVKINALKKYFEEEPPINAYDEIKQRNITLHKLAGEKDEELRRSKIVDEQKTEFISMASHEFKTPITVIKAYTQIAKKLKEQCGDQVKDILDKIDVQSAKLSFLVQQMLDISKIENSHLHYTMQETGVNTYILNIISVLKNIFPDHEVTVDLCDDIAVMIDKLRIEQVFSNILGNAAKYSSKNTIINIACKLTGDGFVRIGVTDQGIGMSALSVQSVFDKFYRASDVIQTHPGLGMGLYITSKIVTDHGGRIWVESTKGAGSTFYFTLPLTGDPQSAAEIGIN